MDFTSCTYHPAQCAPAAIFGKKLGALLNPAERRRLHRLTLIKRQALELFEGNEAAARKWLFRPTQSLNGRCPIQMISTTTQAAVVLDLIGALEHGVVV